MFVLEPFLQLLFNFFFSYPSGTEKLGLAKEIVSLFPSLRIQVPGGDGQKNIFVRVSLPLESHSRKALEKQCLFRGSLCFQLVLLVSSKRLYYIHVTWFDRFLRRNGDDSTTLQ